MKQQTRVGATSRGRDKPHTWAHTCAHTHACTHTHTCTYTRIHTHTYAQPGGDDPLLCVGTEHTPLTASSTSLQEPQRGAVTCPRPRLSLQRVSRAAARTPDSLRVRPARAALGSRLQDPLPASPPACRSWHPLSMTSFEDGIPGQERGMENLPPAPRQKGLSRRMRVIPAGRYAFTEVSGRAFPFV